MGYFSHNPEAYDDIMVNGVARALSSYSPEAQKEQGGAVRQEEIEEVLKGILMEMLYDYKPEARKIWSALTDWAFDSIQSAEQAYWESFVP